jgi:predicted nucleotidyltransferase
MLNRSLHARLQHVAAAAFAGRPVACVYAHGSRVSGRPRANSDLDLAYWMTPASGQTALPLEDELALAGRSAEMIGVEVDLRSLGEASLEFRGRVLEDGLRIYEGEPVARVAFERNTLARYHDYKIEFGIMHELRLKSLAARSA